MSLQLYVSNSLQHLAGKLSHDLQHQQGSVFVPQYIVTQTEGMNNWLKLQIATTNGIAANCLFVSPNEIIHKVYYLLGGKYRDQLSAQNLCWLLYKVLGEKSFTRRFKKIAAYYDYEAPDADLKRMALATKTADLFDQYQVYRPEWIEIWNQGTTNDLAADEWQQYLWLRARDILNERLPDKTVIGQFIKDALQHDTNRKALQDKIPSLKVFGLSIITSYHLSLLFHLSYTIDTAFHIVNPAPSIYWFEDKSDKQWAVLQRKGFVDRSASNQVNALLTSWGKVIQDTFNMLFENEALLNHMEEVDVEPPATDTLLHSIQNDIFYGLAGEERNELSPEKVNDETISISACYTIAREVEVLYNFLVYLVDQKKERLSPRDIAVMVTDIDAYAPYIKAVFKNAPYPFHFTIADESYASGDTLVSALTAVLKINRYNFYAEDVLQLLDLAYIRRRFNINNVALARKLVNAANIRFGIEGKQEDDTRFVSWRYGIKRIMFGLCMHNADGYTDPGGETMYPLDLVEGQDMPEVVRFCHFIDVLIQSIDEREGQQTISGWVAYIERLVSNVLCEPEEDADEDYALLLQQLTSFNVANNFMEDKIGFDIFSQSLLQSISGAGRTGSFAGGGITFCSLIPMRSIPFKVVGLLGLNFDKFPRREVAASFNLLQKDKRRRGDRNVKENDKHLFLETLLSAKEYLYISYIGASVKDNTALPPSVLVDELLDYIQEGYTEKENIRKLLVTQHPLHSFSKKYNAALPRYYNYQDGKKPPQQTVIDNAKTREPLLFDEVSLDRMISFLKHPFKGYYNKVLEINYEEDDVLLSNEERFEIDSLQKWWIKKELFATPAGSVETQTREWVKKGELPLKNMADVQVQNVEEEISPAKALFEDMIADETEEHLTLEVQLSNTLLTGTLHNLYAGKLVFVSYSKHESKYLLEAYIRYLFARAAGHNLVLHFISLEKKKVFVATTLSQAEAVERLGDILNAYKQGHESILPFFPGFNIAPDKVEELNEQTLKKVLKAYFDNYDYPCTDKYLLNERAFGFFDAPDIVDKMQDALTLLIKPLAHFYPDYFKA